MTRGARPGKLRRTVTNRGDNSPKGASISKARPARPLEPRRRFARTDGRFDLPVVTGRTPQEVARRLA